MDHLHLFGTYLDELTDWNRRINLTGLSSRKRIIYEVLLDSLIPVPFIPLESRMLDVGSGAGFPGIVIKILRPGLKVQLMEANSKKVSFLKQVVRLLALKDIDVMKGRVEMYGGNLHGEGYHLITARAVASLDQMINWCAPFLSSNGQLIGFLGGNSEQVLRKSEHAIEKNGLTINRTISYSLPGKISKRKIVIFNKNMS